LHSHAQRARVASVSRFSIRRAAVADVPALAPLFDLYRQFYGKPADRALAASFLEERLGRDESVVFIAESDQGEALGFVQLYPSFSSVSAFPLWVLNDLFVAEQARGLGVGRALMEEARAHAVRTGAKRLTLETVAENTRAWKLYESLGYVLADPSARFYSLEL
jgi:ribosomal protein S18 acetylase RimI-like enzyme